MADSRAHIKLEMDIYGEHFAQEMSINYSPDDGRVDSRISDWFDICYREAYGKWREAMFEQEAATRAKELEEEERATLARLQKKYQGENQ